MLQGSGIHEHQVTHEGLARTYLVHTPNDYDGKAPCRTIMVLHGGGGSAAFASRVHNWRELSQRTGCLVVFPEAECENPSQEAAVRENPRIWNDGSTRSAVSRRNVDDIGYLQPCWTIANGIMPSPGPNRGNRLLQRSVDVVSRGR